MTTVPQGKSLAERNPELVSQWSDRNELTPHDYYSHSTKKVWWVCTKGHVYSATPNHRSRGRGCPFCSGNQALRGFNDLGTTHPDLAEEWDVSKNERPFHSVTKGSHYKAWWVCSLGHRWMTPVKDRSKGYGCPFCSGKRVLPGFNDLVTQFPEVASQWHPAKNTRHPSSVTVKSAYRAVWLCDAGHEWEASVAHRTKPRGCPYCANKRVIPGVNDLATTHPETSGQWHPTRNQTRPTEITAGSKRKTWWVCEEGHEWACETWTRAKGHNCPRCASAGSSKPEYEINEFLESLGLTTQMHHRQIADGYEYDVTVPEKKVAIEFNGLYWHSEKFKERNYHRDKTLAAVEAGWRVIHVWEDDWRDKPEVVKKMLARKLGVSLEERLNARSLDVRTVPVVEARELLDANHIQGSGRGFVRLGLYRGGEPVAVALFLHRKAGEWELTRYGSSCIVRGGFSKLLSAFVKEHSPDKIVTFSDTTVSDGGMYKRLGFVNDGELAPDYMYVVNGSREHKFGYRLKRFRDDPELTYRDGLTERQLAELNGLNRIYDAGKVRWVLSRGVVD